MILICQVKARLINLFIIIVFFFNQIICMIYNFKYMKQPLRKIKYKRLKLAVGGLILIIIKKKL